MPKDILIKWGKRNQNPQRKTERVIIVIPCQRDWMTSAKVTTMLEAIPLIPEKPHPIKPWDNEPGIDEPILPNDPGGLPDE